MTKSKKDRMDLAYKGIKPPKSEDIINFIYCGDAPPYDRGLLHRYVGKILKNEAEHDSDTVAAAMALRDVLHGVNLMKQVDIKWKKIPTGPLPETIHHPAMSIVIAALNNEFPDDGMTQRQHAIAELANLFGYSERSAETLFDKVKSDAKKNLATFNSMLQAGGLEYRAMQTQPISIEDQIRDLSGSSLSYSKKIKAVQSLTRKSWKESQQIYKTITKQ